MNNRCNLKTVTRDLYAESFFGKPVVDRLLAVNTFPGLGSRVIFWGGGWGRIGG